MAPVLATYRLQLHRGFRLRDAARLVPYLARLGISHAYLSPILRARAGSTHGYDVVDPATLNPELGTESDLRRLVAALRRHRMGLVLDLVPNHMATGAENPYWEDVLTRGRRSPYARWFDIAWGAGRSGDARIFLPVLGDRLRHVVARGELRLVYRAGRLRVSYFDQSFPVNPATVPPALRRAVGRGRRAALAAFAAGPAGVRRLRHVLAAQAYRLAYWRRGAREVNYRRFFTLSHLVGLRMEDPVVFRATHALVLEWVRRGWVDGLRIDHVDGLLDPLQYLRRLRRAVAGARAPTAGRGTPPIFVEKILARDEGLRDEWPVTGTTGYDFLAEVEDVFLDADGYRTLERAYRRFTGRRTDFAAAARWGKRRLLTRHLAAEVRRLVRGLAACLPRSRRPAAGALARAIRETIVALDVYRTYVDGRAVPAPDRVRLDAAIARARAAGRAESAALGALAGVLRRPRRGALAFVQRFQQACAPAAAKGVEDTALYQYVPLGSRNEVGAAPDAPLGGAVAALDAANARRARRWPGAMLCTSTHDTKRSADVRARLDVLSEIPAAWMDLVRAWHARHRGERRRVRGRPAPDANTEYLLYQTLVGLWPARPSRGDAAGRALVERVDAYVRKAAREAKRHTSWVEPDAAFEAALSAFVQAILVTARGRLFRTELDALVARIARPGVWNALARTLIHLTAPGIPDLYQGDELWVQTLVDPDNRRAVDFAARRAALGRLPTPGGRGGSGASFHELVRGAEDGRLKLHVVRCALDVRRRLPAVFVGGTYQPLAAAGAGAAHLYAFLRRRGNHAAVTIVPRLTVSLVTPPAAPVGQAVWGDTWVALPRGVAGTGWRSALTGERLPVTRRGGRLAVEAGRALACLPVALLVRSGR